MLSRQSNYFLLRKENETHRADDIGDDRYGNTMERAFKTIIKSVFGRHIVHCPVFRNGDSLHNAQSSIPLVTKLFHEKYFAPVTLNLGLSGDIIPPKHFISHIATKKPFGATNNVSFLIGSRGIGKSTFISNLIVNNAHEWYEKKQIIPLRYDFDARHYETLPSKEQFLHTLCDFILTSYEDLGIIEDIQIVNKIRADYIPKFSNITDGETCFKRLLQKLSVGYPFMPMLIIDNFDFLYHLYDRGLCASQTHLHSAETESEWDKRQKESNDLIQYLMNAFTQNIHLNNLGINVLLALRTDSLNHYRQALEREESSSNINPQVYSIIPPELDVIISRHIDLLREIIQKLHIHKKTGQYSVLLRAVDSIVESSGNTTPIRQKLYQELTALSAQGYRQIMVHLSNYIWLPIGIEEKGPKYTLTRRFQSQYTPPLLAFLLSGKKGFSQFRCKFPNMYLVYSNCEEHKALWPNLLKPHRHSYWLKRLLLEYIAKHEEEHSAIHPARILETFCYADDNKSYEDTIVCLCLGSLAQTDSAHVLHYKIGPSIEKKNFPVVKDINLSTRGKKLIEGFMDSFTYLQLIVEDHLLPIPACVANEFQYKNIDYGYLVQPKPTYDESLNKLLKSKIRQVLIFCDILRISLEFEKEIFSSVFQKLDIQKVKIPNVDEIESKVIHDLEKITRFFSFKISDCITDEDRKSIFGQLHHNLFDGMQV